jgi:hypothetical protein
MVCMLNGLIESQHISSGKIADKQPEKIQSLSIVKKNDRWLENKWIDSKTYFNPFIIRVLTSIAIQQKELIFVIDGSVVGQGCQTLMVSVLWKGKALPIAWKTIQAPKGHFPQSDHLAMLNCLKSLLQYVPTVRCVMLGDGEYDGNEWIKSLQESNFEYVLRTAKDTILTNEYGESFQVKQIGTEDKSYFFVPFCRKNNQINVNFVLWHEKVFKDPIYLLSNLDLPMMAIGYYRKRFKIETLFKDFKSQGFHLHQSKLSDPEKIDRLLIVCALAYLWLIGLGYILAKKITWLKRVYKVQKDTFNLFTVGKRLFQYLKKNHFGFPDISKLFPT